MKKILYTGARSGIAKAVIEKLLLDDYFIYVSVHTLKELESVSKIYSEYKNVSCFKLDVTNKSDRNKVKDLDIDILICNAAVGYGGSILEIPIDKIRENFEVNVFSNFELIQIVLQNVVIKKKGKIIIMSSLAGILPISFLGSYCATKASIIMLAKVLRKELKLINSNIKIKLIEPGIYKTGFNEVMLENKDLSDSLYFSEKQESIIFKEYVMFDIMGYKNLDGIADKIIDAVKSNSNKFIYSSPLSQKTFAKIYQIFKS